MKRVIKGRDQLKYYSSQLDLLFSEVNAPATMKWSLLEAWLRLHTKTQPFGILVWQNNSLVAAALFALYKRCGFCMLSKLGEIGEPYSFAAKDKNASEELVEGLVEELRKLNRPWIINIADLADDDPVVTVLATRLNLSKVLKCSHSPRLLFDDRSDLNKYLSRNTRSAVAKAKNRICRHGIMMEVKWIEDGSEIEGYLDEIVNIHRLRNRQKRGLAKLDDPSLADLFKETLLVHAKAQSLRLLTIRLDGSLAAFSICIHDRGLLWVYANLVSPDWLSYSAGTIANAEVVRSAFDDSSIKGVNWGGGLQRFKLSGSVTVVITNRRIGWSSQLSRLAWLSINKIRSLAVVPSSISPGARYPTLAG